MGCAFVQPLTGPTYSSPKLRELTKDHRREEKQQFPPCFPLGAHSSCNPDATGEPLGWEQLRDPPRWDWTPAARLSPARLSLHARWAAPGCPAFRLAKTEGAPMRDSPHAGAAPNFPPSRIRLVPFFPRDLWLAQETVT